MIGTIPCTTTTITTIIVVVVDIQMKVVEEDILKGVKGDIQMMMIAKEGIQKRRHTLRRKKRTYMGSRMESGRPGDHLEETRMPRTIRRPGDHLEETRMPRTIRTTRTAQGTLKWTRRN
jgi:hypothetical protein